MLTSGGSTKATTANASIARGIQRRGEGRFRTPPMLTDQMQRPSPAGLNKEVKDHVGIKRKLVTQSFFFILVVRLDKRPVNEQGPSDNVGSGHESPIPAVERDGAVIAHGKVAARGNHKILTLNVGRQFGSPGRGHIAALG